MNLKIKLSPEAIHEAIGRLLEMQDNIEYGLKQTVEILTKEGAEVAKSTFGGMASVDSEADGFYGVIRASGDAVYIAEFGAGDATMPVLFENYPGVDVYKGSYSEQVGSHEYAETGRWHFGGLEYTEVEPKAGMLGALYHIKENSTEVALGVIKL